MSERTIDSSIQELTELKAKTKEVTDFLAWKELTSEQYKEEYDKVKTKFDLIRSKVNEIKDYLQSQKDNITLNQHNAIEWLFSSFKELKMWFEWLQTPENFAKRVESKKWKVAEITAWPKSALFDYSLDLQTIKKINPEKLIAKNGNVEYYTVQVPWKWKMVLRIDRVDDWEEVALLQLTNENISDSEIVEEIEAAELTTSGNAFKDVEVDWYNTWNTNWKTLVEWWEWAQDVATWVLASWAVIAWKAWIWSIVWTSWWFTNALAFGKMVIAAWWAAITAIWTVPTLVVWWVATTAWAVTTALTDADLTTKRAKQFWLTKKLDAVKDVKLNYKNN